MSPDRSLRRGRGLTTAAPGRASPRAHRTPLHPPTRWTFFLDGEGDGAWNMAVDTALARRADPDRGILRVYGWERPTLSFGRNQTARRRYDARVLESAGLGAVRRPTGGREVVHDRELTYACILPVGSLGLREAYARINAALRDALGSLGVPAALSPGDGTPPSPDAGPCFGRAVAGEVEVNGRKIAGSAQARIGRSILQHGSIPLAPPRRVPPGYAPGGVSVEEALGWAVPFARVALAVGASVEAAFGGIWERGGPDSGTLSVARKLLREYESPGWTWRR